jgi:ParB family transcriptional regulator, chromosome partitioning protein
MVRERAPKENILESIGVGADSQGITAESSATATARRSPKHEGLVRSRDVAQIPLSRIRADPGQPRKEFDKEAIARLAASLKAKGQLQPIRVRWDDKEGAYMLIVGERRWRAASEAGLESIAAVIHEGPIEPAQLRSIQLIENMLREDLSDIDKAHAMRSLMEEHKWSQRQLAAELGIKQGTVSKTIALLQLEPSIQAKVQEGKIPAASAYPISQLASSEEQLEVAARVEAEKLGREETAQVVEGKSSARSRAVKNPAVAKKPRAKKLKTEAVYNANGYKFAVSRRSGIEPEGLREALRLWCVALDVELRLDEAYVGPG